MMNIINKVKKLLSTRSPFAVSAERIAALSLCATGLMLLGACATSPSAPAGPTPASYAAVVDNPLRTREDHTMDAERHPAEFLAFAQVKPGMRVLDVSTGGGYTTQLLGLAVGPEGKVYAQTPKPGQALVSRLASHPQQNIVVEVRPFDDPLSPNVKPIDLATLVLNYHDITYLSVDRRQMNEHIFAALKPGGHYVIIDHAGRPGTGITEGKTLHRIDEAVVISEVKAAGFQLENESNFLRNPADPRDAPSGNSPIPTDKFALRFVKPG
jgi:predicted methyltransferase